MSTTTKYKTKYLAKSAILYAAITAVLLLSVKVLFAQEADSRTILISPPTVSERFDPGDKKEGTMKITNTSASDTITFKAVIRDFIVEDTKGTPLINVDFGVGKRKYAASSWIGVYPSTFSLSPGQTQTVNYYVQIPQDARPGGRYAAVVYEPQERIDVKGSGTGVETHIGSLFILRINGDIVENASVTRFGASKKFWEYGPITVNTQIYNGSDSHIRPSGTVVLKNLFGKIVATQPLTEFNIFPEVGRDFTNSLGEKLMFGPYTAELKATYGDNNSKTLFASTGLFVLPWKIVAIVILVIVVLVLLGIFLRRRKKNTHSHQDPPQPPVAPAQPAQ